MDDNEIIKAAAAAVGQYIYEHRGRFYPHYVDDRDSCAPWNPLRIEDNAMQLLLECKLSIVWQAGNRVRVGLVTSEQFTPETKKAVLLRTITLAAIESAK